MSNVLKSASKIILLLFGISSSVAYVAVVLKNIASENIVLAVIAMYSGALSSVMTYYFTKRAEKPDDPRP